MNAVIRNAQVACGDGAVADWVQISDGRIVATGSGEPPAADGFSLDAQSGWVVPGYIDMHVHGGGSYSVMDAISDALQGFTEHALDHGVTTVVPSPVTSPPDALLAATEAIAAMLGAGSGRATVVGAHLEGPWISHECKGAHPPTQLREPDDAEVDRLLATGAVRSVTLAPELPGAGRLIPRLREAGVLVVVGHSDATSAQVHAAADAGARHVTHLFNAMRPFHHREPGVVGAALTDPRLTCEVIADGVHVADDGLRLAWQALGPSRMVLITDANAAAGLGDGEFRFAGRAITVDGPHATMADGTIAGSVTTMDVAFARLCRVLGEHPGSLWPVSSRTPATALGIEDHKGAISPGYDADLVVLDADYGVRNVIIGGELHR